MVLVRRQDLKRQGKRKVVIGGGKSGFMKTFKKFLPKLKTIAPIALPLVGSLVASKLFSNNPARAEKVQSVLNSSSKLLDDPTRFIQDRGSQLIDRYAPSVMSESSRQALRDQIDDVATSVGNNETVKRIQKKAQVVANKVKPIIKEAVKQKVEDVVDDVVENEIDSQTGNGLTRRNKNKLKKLVMGSGLMKY